MRDEGLDAPVGASTAREGDVGSTLRSAGRLLLVLGLLYTILAAVELLGQGLAGLGPDATDELFQGIANPIVGLFVGILATVLFQSSSITTATVVGMVGAGVLDVTSAVPVIMGANVGTTITSTLAALASIRRPREFRRAFTGATMHDVYNVLCVCLLLPLEIVTGVLGRVAVWMSGIFGDVQTGEFSSPIKAMVGAATDAVVGLIGRLGLPVFGEAIVTLLLAVALLFASLLLITRNMRRVMAGPAERSLNRVLGRSGALGILVGLVLTVAVQSSSIATSLLVPLIAAGVLTLPNAYPITLGANVGTTVTALIAALAVDRIEGLQIAFVHLLFNTAGLLLFYPVPWLRRLPLALARRVAALAVRNRALSIVYVVLAFYVVPLLVIVLLR